MQRFCLISCKPLSNEFSHLKEIKLTLPSFSIGRGLSNALQIPCLTISRYHCKLIKKGDSWIIEDNSTFGIHVNNTSVGKGNVTSIKHGDTITLDPGHDFVYKFVCEDEGPTPRKRFKLDADKTILINEVTNQLEKLQNDEFNHIEEKIYNNNKLENTKKLLVEQLNLNMVRKINVINKLTTQFENLTGDKSEIQKQQVLLAKEIEIQVAITKQDIAQKIKELEKQIKNHQEMESVLLAEKEYYKEKMIKDRESFMLNTDSTFDQSIVDSIYKKTSEISKQIFKEKMEMMHKLKKVTLELKLEKDKELHELINQKKVIENDSELIDTKQDINEQVEIAEKKIHEVQVQLNEQIEAMKKLEQKDKTLMDQLRHEKEEMSKKLIESQKDAEKAIAELKAKVASTEEELAALSNERAQKQAEQSTETISSLQDQLTKVASELENIKREKLILLENTASSSVECSKQLGEIGDLMENELQCSICADLFINPTTLNCSHTFCQYCITTWKKKKKDCPICRTPIKSECRTLALDSFIEKMVDKLSSEMKQKRQEILKARIEIESNAVLQENTRTRRRNESEEEDSEYETFEEEEEEDDEIDFTRYLYSNYDEYNPYEFDSDSGSDY